MRPQLFAFLFADLLVAAVEVDVQGYIYNEHLPDFRGYPKVRVEVVDYGVFTDTICGSTIAEWDGWWRIACNPTNWRIDDVQRLKIYHRFDNGHCRVNVYRGRAAWARVASGNYSALHDDEPVSDDSLCPDELYPK
ncbi:unnamed protein product [Bursaphelenchus xylophilus]|uniref:(pine wood nematode) hypothetical protein n=1 Tax=Bursaphelenchus xylophilus TaxID=6326 RepID=A0A1I7RUQ4_BURXY|nr:unnamed protein product [Bursaphelenchus xylophilus]CAG9114320.1 unnamed protein product [Bursaphelenchus xylophilus]